jgi:hypothetical protein
METKFYKTADFKKLPLQKRKEMLEQYAKNARTEVIESLEHTKKSAWQWTIGITAAYFAYQFLFKSKRKSKKKNQKIEKYKSTENIIYKKRTLKRNLLRKIQDQIIEFGFDWLLDQANDSIRNFISKKKDANYTHTNTK